VLRLNKINYHDEVRNLLISYILLIIIFRLTFSNTKLLTMIVGVTKFYLILILPALLLTYLAFNNLEYLERLSLAYFIGLAGLAIAAYHSGIFLNAGIQTTLYSISSIIIIVAGYLIYLRNKKSGEEN
jgi:hypothetical protein